MSRPLVVDLFVEDRAHEHFLRPLLLRLARQENRAIRIRVLSARGGHPRAFEELATYQKAIARGLAGLSYPDLLVVAIDANCKSHAAAKKAIGKQLDERFKQHAVIACPDPHIERWYLADPESFRGVVGVRPNVGKRKCERQLYRSILASAVVEAGHPPTLGGIEFADEIVDAMNLYRAGKLEKSLKHFLEDVVAKLKGGLQG